MAIDAAQRRERQRYLGSSDMAAIVGKHPWRGPVDVWLEKSGQLEPEREDDSRSVRAMGAFLEPAVLSWAEAELGVRLSRDLMYVSADGVRCANVDGLALDLAEPLLVEAKTSGLLGDARFADQFGDADTDALPEHILIQIHHQLGVLSDQADLPAFDWAVVPVLLARRGFVLYRVRRDQDLIDALRHRAREFWERYVLAGVAPPDAPPPQLEVLKRIRRTPEKTVPVPSALAIAYLVRREVRLAAENDEAEAQRALIAALGDAEGGTCDLQEWKGTPAPYLISYLAQNRKSYTVAQATYRKLLVREVKAEPKKKETPHG